MGIRHTAKCLRHGEAELKVKIGGKDCFSAYVYPESYVMQVDYELLK